MCQKIRDLKKKYKFEILIISLLKGVVHTNPRYFTLELQRANYLLNIATKMLKIYQDIVISFIIPIKHV